MNRPSVTGLLAIAAVAAGCGDGPSSARTPDVASIRVTADRILLLTGDTAAIAVRVLDRDGRTITTLPAGMEPVVTASDPSILEVQPGRVIAIGSGAAEIVATIGDVRGRTSIRVNPTSLKLSAVLHINQVVQDATGSLLPIVGRAGLLRVYVQADRANFLPLPAVRVRIFIGDDEVATETLERSGFDVPYAPPVLNSTYWDLHVPAELMRPGLGVLLEIDPDGVLPREDDGPVLHPSSGVPQRIAFVDIAPLRIRFVPIHHDGLGTGNVTADNVDEYLTVTRAIHPVVEIDRDVRAPYTPLTHPDSAEYWIDLVFEIDMLRVAEGAGRYYYGIARGHTGRAIRGAPSAVSYDNERLPNFAHTVAHELGHTFGQLHSSTCTADDPFRDPAYPYPNGTIGSVGYDAATRTLLAPDSAFDIMGACGQPLWISDYMYGRAMTFRRFLESVDPGAGALRAADGRVPTLLVWGRMDRTGIRLAPTFEIDARPVLPRGSGAYTLEGRDDSGRVLFAYSFDPAPITHERDDVAGFTFAVPFEFPVESLASIRVIGRGRTAELRTRVAPAGRAALRATSTEAYDVAFRRAAGEVEVRWDADVHDVALITDPRTGDVLGLVRGGSARVRTRARELVLHLSDGVAGAVRRVVVR